MHGSEGAWRKFLNASAMLKVNVAICGGDLTGKMIVPVIERSDGKYNYYLMGKTHTIESRGVGKSLQRCPRNRLLSLPNHRKRIRRNETKPN